MERFAIPGRPWVGPSPCRSEVGGMDACTTQLRAQKYKPTIACNQSCVEEASNLTTKYHEGNETMTLDVACRLSLFKA